ncbi:PIR Superfamily Protein [Plasmodium ovale wallikeri]|uniref:PIR Superfamily Protein n=1 Tax=Plasmodium ovale wallikeri TaxID=864142 RepID=A0A1A9AMF9_PLAOA|nr:PIR Superfamily Protein [Plasmodium ovale wallikeri]
MSGLSYNFNYDEFKNTYNILGKTKFDIVYNEFNNHSEFHNNPKTYCTDIKGTISFPYDDENLILHLCHNLYKINVKINGWQDYLFDELPKNDKTYCISLKYWLYERIDKLDLKGQKIHNNVQQLKEMLESKINSNLSVPCAFNELEWNEHQKLRNLSNYCKEFNEFKEIYKEDYLHWKTSTVDKAYIYSDEDTVNCALQIEAKYQFSPLNCNNSNM